MNKLEEQIEERHASCIQQSFRSGAQFVIDLELPVKFWRWMQHDPSAKGQELLNSGLKIETIYQFWIENIYGR